MVASEIEERHGSPGALRTPGGLGGPLEASRYADPRDRDPDAADRRRDGRRGRGPGHRGLLRRPARPRAVPDDPWESGEVTYRIGREEHHLAVAGGLRRGAQRQGHHAARHRGAARRDRPGARRAGPRARRAPAGRTGPGETSTTRARSPRSCAPSRASRWPVAASKSATGRAILAPTPCPEAGARARRARRPPLVRARSRVPPRYSVVSGTSASQPRRGMAAAAHRPL